MDKFETAEARASSKARQDPPHLRYHPAHRLVAWQPHGVLDDSLLDEIVAWVVVAENTSPLPFNRFVDLTCLTRISVQIGHVFSIARKRREDFKGLAPVRAAFFSDKVVGFGVARLYETLMENSHLEARAFRDRASAAEWLAVPVEILNFKDEPAP